MKPIAACVVDASVGIKLFVNEPLSDVALSFFVSAADTPNVRRYVPDLFFVECANVLWKYVSRYGLRPQAAARYLADLHALRLAVIPTSALTQSALKIAMDLSISVYGAFYVATAELLNVPLITADKRLARRLADTKHHVLYLEELVI
ncbi:MAG TPA: PIN domain-containing protein [Candidatus Hydrogenedentes bacterium]|nr:PIN domain-containing protein [Candidatus Hydrogenedentota bacterium]